MGFTHFFVNRPIFAGVISIIITLVGVIALLRLPITEYPQIAPPTVVVNASFAGASAEVVSQTVATPIEQEINGVDDMIYMVSQATGDGVLSINVVFKPGTNVDLAQVLVQNRVAVALPRLPEEVQRVGVTVRKSSPDLMLVIHLISPDGSLDQQYISNYATINIKDVIARIDGVGDTTVFGARDYSMRVWLDPALIQARGLTASDVLAALRANNIQVAAGAINQPPATSPGSSSARRTIRATPTSITRWPPLLEFSSGRARTRWRPPRRCSAPWTNSPRAFLRGWNIGPSTTRPSSSSSRSTRWSGRCSKQSSWS
jgi:HAE1 family hydrophobic/amphiphilic exporter-1